MPSWWADAAVSTDSVDAGGTALARLWRTLVHIDAAVWTRESLSADAAEPARSRLACSAIVARLPATLVNSLGAKQTSPTWRTAAMRLQSLVRGSRHAGTTILALTGITTCSALRAAFTYRGKKYKILNFIF